MILLTRLRSLPMAVRVPLFVTGNVGAIALMGQPFSTTLGQGLAAAGAALFIATWMLLTLGRPRVSEAGELNRRRLREVLARLEHFETPALLTEAGTLLARTGKPKEAEVYLTRALGHDTGNIEAHYALGQIKLARGDAKEAWPHLSQVHAHDDSYDYAYIRLAVARVYLELGEAEHALSQAQAFLERQPGHPRGLLTAGAAAAELDRAPEAADYLDQALDVVRRAPSFSRDEAKEIAREAGRRRARLK